jgi:hypothetical protein
LKLSPKQKDIKIDPICKSPLKYNNMFGQKNVLADKNENTDVFLINKPYEAPLKATAMTTN